MLTQTFLHIPGIGSRSEQRFWEAGLFSWQDVFNAPERIPLRRHTSLILHYLRRSQEALAYRNIYFFAQLLPPSMFWRLYPEFSPHTVFLDIETNGGAAGYRSTTLVGLYDGETYRPFIAGKNLGALEEALRRYDFIVTFNGKQFDIPFLARDLGIAFYQVHLDLRFLCRRLGYRGGLKRIEQALGIRRAPEVAGLSGYDAVLLWQRYRRGERRALDTLIAYNRQDVESLQAILEIGYRLARERVWPGRVLPLKTA
ncbi:MAG: exonuclease [Nitrospinota bacterium]|nr:MAG: exonuclease [Nitrospinota bacterium]